jgi:hypothetical protein
MTPDHPTFPLVVILVLFGWFLLGVPFLPRK